MSEHETHTTAVDRPGSTDRTAQSNTMTTAPVGAASVIERNTVAQQPPLRVSWGAIFAGSIIGLSILFMLSLLGIGIGLAVVDPAQDANSLSGIGVGSGLFVIVAQLVALAAGGYVAARLAGIPLGMSSALHGAAVWALATFVMLFLATTTIGGIMGGAASMISSAGSGAASTVQSMVPDDITIGQIDQDALPPAVLEAMEENDITPEDLQKDAEAVFKSAVSDDERKQIMTAVMASVGNIVSSPASAKEEINSLIDQLVGENGGVLSDEDRDQAVASLSERLGITSQEAEQTLDQWQQQFTQSVEAAKAAAITAQEEAVQAAQVSSEALSKGALAAFGASLAGLIVAMLAGFFGRQTDLTVEHNAAA